MTASRRTISLIGMPGAGKSTIGVVLAKLSGLRFVDTDLEIQHRAGMTLQQIIDSEGYRALRRLEQDALLQLDLSAAVIATGGSVVYSEAAMKRLKSAGPTIFLEVAIERLIQRVSAAPARGIAGPAEQSFDAIYAERVPLYRRYADITIDANNAAPERIALAILSELA
ncbi:MAG: shikimate kinase [Pseudomonadota bacterium]